MIELKSNKLVFSFPEVHPQARLEIAFERTLRIPDDGKDHFLPPGLGEFPLRHVDDFAEGVPAEWLRHGGVMLPMHQAEAMWIKFDSAVVPGHDAQYPFAVKIAAGKIDAVSGEKWTNNLHGVPQDYVVVPEQPWLDGARYTLAAGIASRASEVASDTARPVPARALIANGTNAAEFVDALALSAVAARTGVPILLVERDRVPAATASILASLPAGDVIIAGGPAVVSAATYSVLGATARWAGDNRYATATQVATSARTVGWLTASTVGLASTVPDPLTGAVRDTPYAPVYVVLDGSTEREALLLEASEEGRWPIVFDTSPCAYRMKRKVAGRLKILDSIEFIHDAVLPRVRITPQAAPVAIHPVCSVRKMGTVDKLGAIAARCSAQVVTVDEVLCCGFAGDKGFNKPELNAHALRHLKPALPAGCDAGYSSSRTCEIGLSEYAQMPYRSFIQLVDACASADPALAAPAAAANPEPVA